jgi:hypothetical protein
MQNSKDGTKQVESPDQSTTPEENKSERFGRTAEEQDEFIKNFVTRLNMNVLKDVDTP